MLEGFNLDRLIESFLKEEIIDDLYCSKCKKSNRGRKKMSLWKLPKILIFHFKRFNFSKYRKEKLNHSVKFPVRNLNLKEHVYHSIIFFI